mgnify:CR=1 FL=1
MFFRTTIKTIKINTIISFISSLSQSDTPPPRALSRFRFSKDRHSPIVHCYFINHTIKRLFVNLDWAMWTSSIKSPTRSICPIMLTVQIQIPGLSIPRTRHIIPLALFNLCLPQTKHISLTLKEFYSHYPARRYMLKSWSLRFTDHRWHRRSG